MSQNITAEIEALPPGYLAQYNGQNTVIWGALLISLDILVLMLRLLARAVSWTPFAIDDIFILAGFICNFGVAVLGIGK